jgi:hypothetical protein
MLSRRRSSSRRRSRPSAPPNVLMLVLEPYGVEPLSGRRHGCRHYRYWSSISAFRTANAGHHVRPSVRNPLQADITPLIISIYISQLQR